MEGLTEIKCKIRIDFVKSGLKPEDFHLIDSVFTKECVVKYWFIDDIPHIELLIESEGAFSPETYLSRCLSKKLKPSDVFEFLEFENPKLKRIQLYDYTFKTHVSRRLLGNDRYKNAIEFRKIVLVYENYQNLEFSEVYLNDAGNKIFNSSFFTSEIGFDSEFEKDFSLKYESLFTEYIELNGFKYLPLFHFYDGGNTEYKIEYRKEPYLKIFGPENCTATDIHKFVKTYCCLLSYYSGLVVGFTNAKYVTKDEVAIVIQKTVKHPGNHTDRFWYDYNNNPALFIDQLNFSKAVENYELLREAVSKFLLGQQSTGRIKFILYYNVLEMIRTKHTQGISSIEFNFTLPDGVESAEELIKKQLQELVNYLPEDEKQTFSNKLEGMASTIKLKSMNNQFGDMFKNMGIDCKRDFDFKFKEVIEIRNKIFHGGEFDFNENATLLDILKPSKMPALIDKVFFKFLEVKMLQEEQV